MARVVLPLPFEVFTNDTVSLYVPAANELALLLMLTLTVVDAPGLSEPLVCDSETHAADFEAVQFNVADPVLLS